MWPFFLNYKRCTYQADEGGVAFIPFLLVLLKEVAFVCLNLNERGVASVFLFINLCITETKEAGFLFLSAPLEEAWPLHMSITFFVI